MHTLFLAVTFPIFYGQWFGFFKENSNSETYGFKESPEYNEVPYL